MRPSARSSRTAATLGALCATVAVVTTVAGAPSAVDLYVDIGVGSSLQDMRPVPNGGSKNVVGLTIWAGPGVEIINPEAATARVRFDLPAGLRWGTDEPDPGEQCTSTPSSGTCQTPLLEPITGRTGVGWAWQIVAERVGSYVLRAELVETSARDAEPSNDTASVTVVVTDTPSPPPPPSAGARASGPQRSPRRGRRPAGPSSPQSA